MDTVVEVFFVALFGSVLLAAFVAVMGRMTAPYWRRFE
jgi:hypothetical protein